MSLLTDIAANALEPGYAQAAQAHARRPAGRGPRIAVAVTVGIAALLVVVDGAQAALHAPADARARGALVAQVQGLESQTAALAGTVRNLQAEVAAASASALSADAAGTGRLVGLERDSGMSPLSGPGLVVILNDAPTASPDTLGAGSPATGQNRILDSDLQAVVNALWAAGARGIAINGERLTALTAIRTAGAAILVDFSPLSPPYTVEAVGDPVAIETGFGGSATAAQYRTYQSVYGLGFSYHRASGLSLPAATDLVLHEAEPLP